MKIILLLVNVALVCVIEVNCRSIYAERNSVEKELVTNRDHKANGKISWKKLKPVFRQEIQRIRNIKGMKKGAFREIPVKTLQTKGQGNVNKKSHKNEGIPVISTSHISDSSMNLEFDNSNLNSNRTMNSETINNIESNIPHNETVNVDPVTITKDTTYNATPNIFTQRSDVIVFLTVNANGTQIEPVKSNESILLDESETSTLQNISTTGIELLVDYERKQNLVSAEIFIPETDTNFDNFTDLAHEDNSDIVTLTINSEAKIPEDATGYFNFTNSRINTSENETTDANLPHKDDSDIFEMKLNFNNGIQLQEDKTHKEIDANFDYFTELTRQDNSDIVTLEISNEIDMKDNKTGYSNFSNFIMETSEIKNTTSINLMHKDDFDVFPMKFNINNEIQLQENETNNETDANFDNFTDLPQEDYFDITTLTISSKTETQEDVTGYSNFTTFSITASENNTTDTILTHKNNSDVFVFNLNFQKEIQMKEDKTNKETDPSFDNFTDLVREENSDIVTLTIDMDKERQEYTSVFSNFNNFNMNTSDKFTDTNLMHKDDSDIFTIKLDFQNENQQPDDKSNEQTTNIADMTDFPDDESATKKFLENALDLFLGSTDKISNYNFTNFTYGDFDNDTLTLNINDESATKNVHANLLGLFLDNSEEISNLTITDFTHGDSDNDTLKLNHNEFKMQENPSNEDIPSFVLHDFSTNTFQNNTYNNSIPKNDSGVFITNSEFNNGIKPQESATFEDKINISEFTDFHNNGSVTKYLHDDLLELFQGHSNEISNTKHKRPNCPDPGLCIFWFLALDTCSKDSHCDGSLICCKWGCSKMCIDADDELY